MADDWFEPATFNAVARAFLMNPDADMVSCGGRIVSYDRILNHYKYRLIYTAKQLDLTLYNMCFGIPAMSSRFLTRSLIEKIGLMIAFDANGQHIFSADRELLLRAAAIGCKNINIDHLGHTYLAHKQSATFGRKRSNRLKIYQEHMDFAESYLQQYHLSKEQQSILRHWYNDQSIRLLIFKLLEGDFQSAWAIVKNGVKKSKWEWLMAWFTTPCRIIKKNGSLYFMRMIKSDKYVCPR
jgi:hypothetical protein